MNKSQPSTTRLTIIGILLLLSISLLLTYKSSAAGSFDHQFFLPILQNTPPLIANQMAVVDFDNNGFVIDGQGANRAFFHNKEDGAIINAIWSPDHTQLAATVINDQIAVSVFDLQAESIRNVANNSIVGSWSAESGIAIRACDNEIGNGIITMKPDGTNVSLRHPNGVSNTCQEGGIFFLLESLLLLPQYMSDGETILSNLDLIDVDGSVTRIPTPDEDKYVAASNSYTVVAADGQIYVAAADNSDETQNILLRFDAATQTWQELLRLQDQYITVIKPSPDAQSIALFVNNDPSSATTALDSQLLVLNLDTLATKNLTPKNDASGAFDWSPDSRKIAIGLLNETSVITIDTDFGDLYVIHVKSGVQTKIDDVLPTQIMWAK